MSYESPIKIIQNNFDTSLENEVMKVVMSYGISVDKDELLKALKYDRDQYEKGFAEGKRFIGWDACNDLVSKQAVYDIIKKTTINTMPLYAFEKLWHRIDMLPPAYPETIPIEQVAYEVGCATCETAFYWLEFLKNLDVLGFAIVKKQTRKEI